MNIDYFFDPVCPYCWVTSRWVVDITGDRDLEVNWRFISLRILNDGMYDEKPPGYEAGHAKGRELLRVAAAVSQQHGAAKVGDLYTAMGEAIWHVPGQNVERREHLGTFDQAKVEELLESVDLDVSFATAMTDESLDEVLAADTELALERTGRDVGTPIITYGTDGPSFFGPVISEVPEHSVGLRMWDALSELIEVGTFAELKRSQRGPLDLPLLRT